MDKLYFDDLVVGRRERFGRYPVTREEVIEIASRFDPQSFHLDEEAGAANPLFGRMSASGLHTFAIASRLMADYSKTIGFQPAAGLGMQDMRLFKPVYPGDVLSGGLEFTHLRLSTSRPECGVVTMRVEALNQHDELVLRFHAIVLVERRPGAASA